MGKQNATSKAGERMLDAISCYSKYLATYGSSIWEQYVLTALSDSKVQKHFLKHVENNELFVEARCWAGPGMPEEAQVLFLFNCLPPAYSFVPSAFLVRINTADSKVVETTDPYDGQLLRSGIEGAISLFAERCQDKTVE